MIEQFLNNWSQIYQGEWYLWPSCSWTWYSEYNKWDSKFCSKSWISMEQELEVWIMTTFLQHFLMKFVPNKFVIVSKNFKVVFSWNCMIQNKKQEIKLCFIGKFPKTQVTKHTAFFREIIGDLNQFISYE